MTTKPILATFALALPLGFAAFSGPAYAGDAECAGASSGQAYEVIDAKSAYKGLIGQTAYKPSRKVICVNDTKYGRRDLTLVARNTGIDGKGCGAKMADAQAFSGGATRGNGC